MARTTAFDTQREIVIERREEIGTVVLNPNGTVDPVRAAFTIGIDYMIEHGGGESIRLEFTFGGAVHRMSYEPAE